MKLKDWREANRYTKAAIARKLVADYGVKADRTNVWHWENGTKPRKAVLKAIEDLTKGKVKPASFS